MDFNTHKPTVVFARSTAINHSMHKLTVMHANQAESSSLQA